ncbi:MAG: hypothetical protein PHN74_03505, partial [Candidatus Pacebacteria bacterium]|nr:hypothetical protein [Candidatus Paceibacterota bacterium]
MNANKIKIAISWTVIISGIFFCSLSYAHTYTPTAGEGCGIVNSHPHKADVTGCIDIPQDDPTYNVEVGAGGSGDTVHRAGTCDSYQNAYTSPCRVGDVEITCDNDRGTSTLCIPIVGGGANVKSYKTNYGLPCVNNNCSGETSTPAGMVARLYQVGIGIAGFLAFGAIILGALRLILLLHYATLPTRQLVAIDPKTRARSFLPLAQADEGAYDDA